jgi:hypothetical protein
VRIFAKVFGEVELAQTAKGFGEVELAQTAKGLVKWNWHKQPSAKMIHRSSHQKRKLSENLHSTSMICLLYIPSHTNKKSHKHTLTRTNTHTHTDAQTHRRFEQMHTRTRNCTQNSILLKPCIVTRLASSPGSPSL